jgi:cytochrome b561
MGAAGPLPDFDTLAPRAVHGATAFLLLGLATAHVAAALYHQAVRRDRLLGRMGIGPLAP